MLGLQWSIPVEIPIPVRHVFSEQFEQHQAGCPIHRSLIAMSGIASQGEGRATRANLSQPQLHRRHSDRSIAARMSPDYPLFGLLTVIVAL